MSQENFSNSQEEAKVNSAPKPFDPKDEARIAELNAKFEGGKEQKDEQEKQDLIVVEPFPLKHAHHPPGAPGRISGK